MSAHYSKPLARLGKCDSSVMKKKHKTTILIFIALIVIDLLIILLPFQSFLIHKHRGFAKSADRISVNLSGTYTFNKKDSSGHYSLGNPFIATSMMSDDSKVLIKQDTDNKIFIVSYWDNGNIHKEEFDVTAKEYEWHQGSLVYSCDRPPVGPPIMIGFGKQIRAGIVSVDDHGDITIGSVFVEKGLMLFFIPFVDYNKYSIVLEKQ